MRSHAKASSLGSNPDRGASRRFTRRSGVLVALLAALMAAACLLPGSALAIEYRSLTGTFGSDGTSGSGFSYVGPLALDQGNKHLYALDEPAQKLYGFNASTPGTHTPLGGSFPLSEPAASYYDGIAVDSALHHIYLASYSEHKLFGFDESGSAVSGFPISGLDGYFGGGVCGVATDTSGNIWLKDGTNLREFNSAGEPYEGAGALNEPSCHIAADDEGNVFAANPFGATYEYTAASGWVNEEKIEIDPEPTFALALDHSTGELYVVHETSISVYDAEGNFLYEFGGGGNYYGEFSGIAIDEATEEVYVASPETGKIDVFGPPLSVPRLSIGVVDGITSTGATLHGTVNPKGQTLEDCHFEVVPASQYISSQYNNVTAEEKFPCVPAPGSIPVDSNPHAISAALTGLEPGTVYHYRLTAKNTIGEARSSDRQFTSGPAAPLVEEQAIQAVGNADATVTAKINPQGGETTYHVEYGTTEAYGQSSEESSAFGFPTDHSKHPVSVHISGLEPGVAYHFRFVATNEVGTTNGADTTFATYPGGAPAFAPCPDDQFRAGAGARLPDCRAYEQATPIDKHGSNAQVSPGPVSASGDRFTFFANGGLPASGGLSNITPFLATRGPGGWSFDGVLPPTLSTGSFATPLGTNEDLSAVLVKSQGAGGVGEQLFIRDSETATFEPGPAVAGELHGTGSQGFAADPRHLIFVSETQLLPSAPANTRNLYDLDHGALTLVDRVPAGSEVSCDDEAGPACVVPAEGMREGSGGEISRDGSRVFFTVRGPGQPFNSGRLYVREDGTKTARISASQRTTPDPGGEKQARFAGITPDGSKAFFLSCEKLTDDSTANSSGANACAGPLGNATHGQDLYSYDAGTGELTDLSVDTNVGDPSGAGVKEVLGTSEDGSYVYFFAEGVLAPGGTHSECTGFQAKCNLYVYHNGVTTFIARPQTGFIQARVSADGRAILFSSSESLTSYNSSGTEFFRYSAPDEELLCVSCNPTGLPPISGVGLGTKGNFIGSGIGIGSGPPRNLSANGNRVFFESGDALVPTDTNGKTDVYEWEAKGEGSCESESQDGGCIYLISSGTSPERSTFLGASRNGDHVFVFTEQQLVPTDEDRLIDVYDAAVDGGLASQHTLSPPSCSSTACQANPAPPPDPSLASAAYSGAGNVHPHTTNRGCPKGTRKVRGNGKSRCQRKHRKRAHKRHHNRANVNRGGSK